MASQTMRVLATFRPLCKGILRQGQEGYLTRASEDIIRAVSNQPGERASSDEGSGISAAPLPPPCGHKPQQCCGDPGVGQGLCLLCLHAFMWPAESRVLHCLDWCWAPSSPLFLGTALLWGGAGEGNTMALLLTLQL